MATRKQETETRTPVRPKSNQLTVPDAQPKAGLADVSDVLKPIPVVGPLLALVAKHLGLSAAVTLILVLLVLPLLYPIIMSGLLKAMPDQLRNTYATFVVDALQLQDVLDARVDGAIERIVKDNNERLDFVQQFQQNWQTGFYRSPAYTFPLSQGQHFEIGFSARTVPNKPPCKADQAEKADKAINDDHLFTIRALGVDRFSVDANGSEPRAFGDMFWSKATSELDSLQANKGKTVQVVINQALAKQVFPCYGINSTMEVVVRKTIKAGKLRAEQSASAASTKRP